jgi:hypothetical protein
VKKQWVCPAACAIRVHDDMCSDPYFLVVLVFNSKHEQNRHKAKLNQRRNVGTDHPPPSTFRHDQLCNYSFKTKEKLGRGNNLVMLSSMT